MFFSRDGIWLASTVEKYQYHAIMIWHVKKGVLQTKLNGHDYCDFSSDGRWLVTGSFYTESYKTYSYSGSLPEELRSYTNLVKVWEVGSWTLKRQFERCNKGLFSPDSKILITVDSWQINLWNTEDFNLQKEIRIELQATEVLKLSPDGQLLAVGDENKIHLWQINGVQLKNTLEGHTRDIQCLEFSANGQLLASGSIDKTIRLWNVTKGTLQKTFEGHIGWVSCLRFSPNTALLISSSWDYTLKFWDVNNAIVQNGNRHTQGILSIQFCRYENKLISCSRDQTIKFWNSEVGIHQKTLSVPKTEICEFNQEGSEFAVTDDTKSIILGDTKTGLVKQVFSGHKDSRSTYNPLTTLCFSPDGKLLASGGSDHHVKVWNIKTGELKQLFCGGYSDDQKCKGHKHSVFSLCFSPKGDLLASGSLDKTIKLWFVENHDNFSGTLKATLSGHTDGVSTLCFNLNGQLLISGGAHLDKTIKIWNILNAELLQTLQGHSDCIISLKCLPIGVVLVSAGLGDDNTLRIWSNIGLPEEKADCSILRLKSHVKSLSYKNTERGLFIASSHEDNAVRCWQLMSCDNKFYLQLIWSSWQNALIAQEASIENVTELSSKNEALLREYGAVERSLPPVKALIFNNLKNKPSNTETKKSEPDPKEQNVNSCVIS